MSRNTVYIGFGSNQGNREFKFKEVLKEFGRLSDVTVTKSSSLYETDPVGLSDEGQSFINAVIEAQTDVAPRELMALLRDMESVLGKSPTHRSDLSRTVDLDLLLYGDLKFKDTDLEIPHPRMHTRGFVLAPLAEIAPEVVHPVLECTVRELLKRILPEELQGVRALTVSVATEN
ncbi:MAG: 2-amino-4-hydroxy-6-hydroxymethyldihydropteridine diphosphokinase [Desulfomonile tiedjei]|uniref:2-amino-4-hydroxy-6-hydroxymethyldihydropteridine pyrophosphokinase n=1 Tax=Desulfomonile tiedjei TaxID=2358 RepID=A0A9D6V2W0_9BACT|nr:2-amino-4-hydroxy-6-hydroxymethyldihydropteridine diphosphokinase [Desulfomonile tiedjei]